MSTDLSVRIGKLVLKNPILTASGTSGYGDELSDYFDVSTLGATVTKSLTLKPKIGNEPPRIAEVTAGMLNSIGLANIGMDKFLSERLPRLIELNASVIVNIAAKRTEDYVSLASRLENVKGISGVEVNLSCPNVKEGGLEFGSNLEMLAGIVKQVRKAYTGCLIIKLTPNVTRIADFAKASEDEGADAVTVANTYVGMAVDIYTGKPKLHTITGGLSGPAVKPLTLAKVFQVRNAVRIPIIASGGVFKWQDVVEYMIAGAAAVEVGTLLFTKPNAPVDMLRELERFVSQQKRKTISELIGSLNVNLADVPHNG